MKCSHGKLERLQLGPQLQVLPAAALRSVEASPDGKLVFLSTSRNGLWAIATEEGKRWAVGPRPDTWDRTQGWGRTSTCMHAN